MKMLILGASGRLGGTLMRECAKHSIDTLGTSHGRWREGLVQTDIADRDSLREVFMAARPDIVVLAAAMADPDKCEASPNDAFRVNVEGARQVAKFCGAYGSRLVFISTDYVFDGLSGPFAEDAKPHPNTVYGKTKLEAEGICAEAGALIVRTSGLFEAEQVAAQDGQLQETGRGADFAMRMYSRLAAGESVTLPNDRFFTPTYAPDFATALMLLLFKGKTGVFHVAGPDFIDRASFARLLCRRFDFDPALVQGVAAENLGGSNPRPPKAGLLCGRLRAETGYELMDIAHALTMMRMQLVPQTQPSQPLWRQMSGEPAPEADAQEFAAMPEQPSTEPVPESALPEIAVRSADAAPEGAGEAGHAEASGENTPGSVSTAPSACGQTLELEPLGEPVFENEKGFRVEEPAAQPPLPPLPDTEAKVPAAPDAPPLSAGAMAEEQFASSSGAGNEVPQAGLEELHSEPPEGYDIPLPSPEPDAGRPEQDAMPPVPPSDEEPLLPVRESGLSRLINKIFGRKKSEPSVPPAQEAEAVPVQSVQENAEQAPVTPAQEAVTESAAAEAQTDSATEAEAAPPVMGHEAEKHSTGDISAGNAQAMEPQKTEEIEPLPPTEAKPEAVVPDAREKPVEDAAGEPQAPVSESGFSALLKKLFGRRQEPAARGEGNPSAQQEPEAEAPPVPAGPETSRQDDSALAQDQPGAIAPDENVPVPADEAHEEPNPAETSEREAHIVEREQSGSVAPEDDLTGQPEGKQGEPEQKPVDAREPEQPSAAEEAKPADGDAPVKRESGLGKLLGKLFGRKAVAKEPEPAPSTETETGVAPDMPGASGAPDAQPEQPETGAEQPSGNEQGEAK